ncbi:hypothetical protein LLH23_17320 [bacterium]|nr:hypothetical protein [bacterium]
MAINWGVVGWACFGGFIAEFLRWYGLKDSPNLPAYKASVFYWIMTIIMIALGGVLAVLYKVAPENPVLAVNIGASAPLIIKALASVAPKLPEPGGATPSPAAGRALSGAGGPRLVDFLAGR